MKEYIVICIAILLLYFTGIYLKARYKTGNRFSFWNSVTAIISFTIILVIGLLRKDGVFAGIIVSSLYAIIIIYLAVKAFRNYKKAD